MSEEGKGTKANPSKNTENRFNVVPIWEYDTDGEGISHISLSPNKKEVALSQWDGNIQIISSRTGRISYTVPFIDKKSVVTSTKFHPTDKLIISTGTSGHVCMCKFQSSNYTWSSREEDNSIYACDFSLSGDKIMTGGKDASIRLYDTETGKNIKTYSKKDGVETYFHNSRIYSIVSDPTDNNRFVSGGWDRKVIVWDIRTSDGVMHIGGPNICGDSIDIRKSEILTGSWRSKSQLELWDIRNCNLIRSEEAGSMQIYGAKFSRASDFLVAGGSDSQNIRIFNSHLAPKERLGFFEGSVTAVAAAADGSAVFAATQSGKCVAFAKGEAPQ